MSAMWAQFAALACAAPSGVFDAFSGRFFAGELCKAPIATRCTPIATSVPAAQPLSLPTSYVQLLTSPTPSTIATDQSMALPMLVWAAILVPAILPIIFEAPEQPSANKPDASPPPIIPPHVNALIKELAILHERHAYIQVPESEWRRVLDHDLFRAHAEMIIPLEYRRNADGVLLYLAEPAPEHQLPTADNTSTSPETDEDALPSHLEASEDDVDYDLTFATNAEVDAASASESSDASEEIPALSPASDISASYTAPAVPFADLPFLPADRDNDPDAYLNGEDVAGNNLPKLDEYPPEDKTYLWAWNTLLLQDKPITAADLMKTILNKEIVDELQYYNLTMPSEDDESSAAPERAAQDVQDGAAAELAAQDDTELTAKLTLPHSAESYVLLTPSRSYNEGQYHLYHDVAVITLAFWIGYDHAEQNEYDSTSILALCSFLSIFPSFARSEFAEKLANGVEFAEWDLNNDFAHAYNSGLRAVVQVILIADDPSDLSEANTGVRVDELPVPCDSPDHILAYIAGWRAGVRKFYAAGPKGRALRDKDCFAYGWNGLREGQMITEKVIRSINRVQLQDFLTATSHVIYQFAMDPVQRARELGRRQALYGVDKRDARCDAIRGFSLPELNAFRDGYLDGMLLVIEQLKDREYEGPFSAIASNRFTVEDFAKGYFAHAGTERYNAATLSSRFKHMTAEQLVDFLAIIWRHIGDLRELCTDEPLLDLAAAHPDILQLIMDRVAIPWSSPRMVITPPPTLTVSPSPSPSQSPSPSLTPAPFSPPIPAPSDAYIMGHEHAVVGFAHIPNELDNHFAQVRALSTAAFAEYRRGWLAGMLELVARSRGMRHDGYRAPAAYCQGIGAPKWLYETKCLLSPAELVEKIGRMRPNQIWDFLAKGWKKLNHVGRKGGRYDYDGCCDIDVVHVGEPSLNDKINMALGLEADD
ncbi:hypothetical protein HDZ31DRAFT_76826 [Schizophyllum fasciatum]